MRLMDAVLSFPPLVLALALGAVLGAGLGGVLIALGVVYTPTFARLMRGQVLDDHGARVRGRRAGAGRARLAHRLRATCCPTRPTPIVVQASLSVAFAILAEASLSFLGLGIQPPARVVGQHDQRRAAATCSRRRGSSSAPARALFVTVVGLNFVGDAVRDALDPRARG